MVDLGCGACEKILINKIPLSNDLIRRRIDDMSGNVLCQVIEQIRRSPFGVRMQQDESTDVSQCSQLLVFVLYFDGQNTKRSSCFMSHFLPRRKLRTY